MRWIAFTFISFAGIFHLCAGSIEPFGGDPIPGKIELDSGGMIFRPDQGPAVKVDFSNCYRVVFDAPTPEVCVPGVMLNDGSRLAAPYSALTEAAVKFPRRNNLSIPSAEIAWIIYQRFPAALVANAPAGETGALLPGGDFFSGTVRGADAEAVKVFNEIFGPRRLDARKGEVFAAVLRPARPLTAQYEFRTADGGLFGADVFAAEHSGATLRNQLYDGLKLATAEIVEIRAGLNRCRLLSAISQLHAEPAAGLRVTPEGGLITESKAVITCPVPAGFTEFVARVAPGDDVAAGQRVVFTIYVNGAPVGRSTPQGTGDPPQVLRIPLNAARALNLRVDSNAPAGTTVTGRWVQCLFVRR